MLTLLVLAALGVFAGAVALFVLLMLVVALVPVLIAISVALKRRAQKRSEIQRAQKTVLKHVWEEHQNREW